MVPFKGRAIDIFKNIDLLRPLLMREREELFFFKSRNNQDKKDKRREKWSSRYWQLSTPGGLVCIAGEILAISVR